VTLILSSQIFGPAFVEPRVAACFSDESYFRALLEVEVALAKAQAELGIIPERAASAIAQAARELPCDATTLEALAAGVLRDGVPVVALVARLRGVLAPEHALHVHAGATTQDIVDTATLLLARRALEQLELDLLELLRQLGALARAHRHDVMAARTHAQQAAPTSFGLKVAGWALPLVRHQERLAQLRERLLVVQLGGAAGTLLALGPRALELAAALGRELGLGVPELPWHTQRDNIAELGGWLVLLTGSLGKLAQDVILMCQSEVAELSEAPHGQRGGSSSMPHKNNPMRSEQILAAARSVGAQSGALGHALVQEHERGTHGWQVEWLCLPPMLVLSAGALRNALELTRDLVVRPQRMRENLLAQHGLALAEAAVVALCAELPRPEASALVAAASARALSESCFVIDVLRDALAQKHPHAGIDWASLALPQNHLGQAGALIDRALARIDAATAR
jgi:3-carboxy-cis,cis-muconate cycloisomerase